MNVIATVCSGGGSKKERLERSICEMVMHSWKKINAAKSSSLLLPRHLNAQRTCLLIACYLIGVRALRKKIFFRPLLSKCQVSGGAHARYPLRIRTNSVRRRSTIISDIASIYQHVDVITHLRSNLRAYGGPFARHGKIGAGQQLVNVYAANGSGRGGPHDGWRLLE